MPYRVSTLGKRALDWYARRPGTPSIINDLTDWQKQVLFFLEGREGFTTAHEIGLDLKLHPRAVSGIAYSLIKKGLVEKPKGE